MHRVPNKNRISNSVDSDEMANYELSYLDLYCLLRYQFLSAGPTVVI